MENNVVEPQTVNAQEDVTKKHSGKMGGSLVINTLARIFIIAADVAFIGVMAYLFVLLILNAAGSNISSLFGKDIVDFGFFESLGIFVWAIIALIAATIVAIAIGFVKLTDNYYRVLKMAKEQELNIVLAPRNLSAFIFPVVLVLAVFGFLILGFIQNNFINIASVLIMVSAAALVLALVFSVIFAIINRARFNKLSDEEKAKVRELSKTFRRKVVKAENTSRTGKLY